jgi:hypothetical protein
MPEEAPVMMTSLFMSVRCFGTNVRDAQTQNRYSSSGGTLPYIQGLPAKGGILGCSGFGSELHLVGEFDAFVRHLSAGGDFEIRVRGEACFVTAAVRAKGLLGGHIADDAVGKLAREGEGVLAAFFDVEAVLHEVLGGIGNEARGADFDALHFAIDQRDGLVEVIEHDDLLRENPFRGFDGVLRLLHDFETLRRACGEGGRRLIFRTSWRVSTGAVVALGIASSVRMASAPMRLPTNCDHSSGFGR